MDQFVVEVVRRPYESWGLKITGDTPCLVESVKPGSPAEEAGVQKLDQICAVNGYDVTNEDHDLVVELIRKSKTLMRLRLLPKAKTGTEKRGEEKTSAKPDECIEKEEKKRNNSWFNDDLANQQQQESDEEEDEEEEDFDHTNYDKYCQLLSELSLDKGDQAYDMRPKYEENKGDVEQRNFIITRQDQKDFDENHSTENSIFQGNKAAVAGAFTGEHNVIRSENNDVRGVHKRVIAGIQHFNHTQEQVRESDKGKLILYTTSLGVNRIISSECEEVRKIFRRYRVRFEDRDIFTTPEHKVELYERLKMKNGEPLPPIPRVYIDGVYVGGFTELNAMSDCGDLRIRLKDYPKYNYRSSCPTCKTTGYVVCSSCDGKTYRSKTRFSQLKCGTCRQKGTLPCPDCLS